MSDSSLQLNFSVFLIRIGLNADLDQDPASCLNGDPDPARDPG